VQVENLSDLPWGRGEIDSLAYVKGWDDGSSYKKALSELVFNQILGFCNGYSVVGLFFSASVSVGADILFGKF
jgi:hypothetical protein